MAWPRRSGAVLLAVVAGGCGRLGYALSDNPFDGGPEAGGRVDGGLAEAGPPPDGSIVLDAQLLDAAHLEGGSGEAGPPPDGATGFCGDGVVQAGEECDDGGSNVPGCVGCVLEDQGGAGESCFFAATQVRLVPSGPGRFAAVASGDTRGGVDDETGSCDDRIAAGPDRMHTVQTAVGMLGDLTVTVTPETAGFDPTVFVELAERTCSMARMELACGDSAGPDGSEAVSLSLLSDHTYYIYVDSDSTGPAGGGAYRMRLEFTAL